MGTHPRHTDTGNGVRFFLFLYWPRQAFEPLDIAKWSTECLHLLDNESPANNYGRNTKLVSVFGRAHII